MALACEVGSVNETPETVTSTSTPGPAATLASEPTRRPTPTPQPTPTQIPTPGPTPGNDRGSARSIDLGEVAWSSFSLAESERLDHYWEVQFEEGTTYTINPSLVTLFGSLVRLDDDESVGLAFESAGSGIRSDFAWTAKKSGSHFVVVQGISSGSYRTFGTQHLAVLTYSSGLHMLEQTAVSSRSGVSVIDIPSKEKK